MARDRSLPAIADITAAASSRVDIIVQSAQATVPKDGQTRYSADLWQTAYQMWCYTCGRNEARTARELAAALAPDPTPSQQAIRQRADREHWHGKADAELAQLSPAIDRRDKANLYTLRAAAIDTHRAVLAGEVEPRRILPMLAAVRLAYEATGVLSRASDAHPFAAEPDTSPVALPDPDAEVAAARQRRIERDASR